MVPGLSPTRSRLCLPTAAFQYQETTLTVPPVIFQPGMVAAAGDLPGMSAGPYVSQPMVLAEVSGSSKLPFTSRLIAGGGGGGGGTGRSSSVAVRVMPANIAVIVTEVIDVTFWVV